MVEIKELLFLTNNNILGLVRMIIEEVHIHLIFRSGFADGWQKVGIICFE